MNISYSILKMKCGGQENKGFVLDRPFGTDDYLFILFRTPVNILQDGHLISTSPGTCIITKPKYPHHFESPECKLNHDWVHFFPDKPDEFLSLGFPINKIFTPYDTSFITPIMSECQREFISREPYWEDSSSALLSNLFFRLARSFLIEKPQVGAYMQRLRKSFTEYRYYMYESTSRPLTVNDMAKSLSLSRSRFSILYTHFFGVSPKEDFINARISHAKYLLDNNAMKLDEIANRAGYESVYHFIRQFKSKTGITPGEYRKSR